jgi:hypothetical protein
MIVTGERTDGRTLLGPLLTERQLCERVGAAPLQLRSWRYLLRVDGRISAGPAYPAFQLDEHGLRLEVCFISLILRRRMPDLEVCDWLVRALPELGTRSPLDWLNQSGRLATLVDHLPIPAEQSSERHLRAEEVRRTWLGLRSERPTPGWATMWERLALSNDAYPLGI